MRDQVRIEATARGSSVTILESCPLWQANQAEWSAVRVAQLRYSASTHDWNLYWADCPEKHSAVSDGRTGIPIPPSGRRPLSVRVRRDGSHG